MAGETLDQLEEQEKQLKAKLMAVKKSIDDQRNRVSIIVGSAVLDEAEANASYKPKLMKVLDKHVQGKRNRALVGLEGVRSTEGGHEKTGD